MPAETTGRIDLRDRELRRAAAHAGGRGSEDSVFGGGTRIFEHLGGEHIELEPIEAIETRAATHLRYRIVK